MLFSDSTSRYILYIYTVSWSDLHWGSSATNGLASFARRRFIADSSSELLRELRLCRCSSPKKCHKSCTKIHTQFFFCTSPVLYSFRTQMGFSNIVHETVLHCAAFPTEDSLMLCVRKGPGRTATQFSVWWTPSRRKEWRPPWRPSLPRPCCVEICR